MTVCRLVVVILIYMHINADTDAGDSKFEKRRRFMKDSKIVGGHEVDDIRQYPFMVNIFVNGSSECGGSILSPLFVLTACHCLATFPVGTPGRPTADNKSNYVFLAGCVIPEYSPPNWKLVGAQPRRPKEFFIYQFCAALGSGNATVYDLGLAEMKSPFTTNDFVKPIPLVTPFSDLFAQISEKILDNKTAVCEVAGWGMIIDPADVKKNNYTGPLVADQLKAVRMYPASAKYCLQVYKKIDDVFFDYSFHDHDQICAISKFYNESDCLGDSGGPFICNGFLIGIVSFGGKCGSVVPMIYQLVTPMYEWIHQELPDLARFLGIQKYCPDRETCKLTTIPKPTGRPSRCSSNHVKVLLLIFISHVPFFYGHSQANSLTR